MEQFEEQNQHQFKVFKGIFQRVAQKLDHDWTKGECMDKFGLKLFKNLAFKKCNLSVEDNRSQQIAAKAFDITSYNC